MALPRHLRIAVAAGLACALLAAGCGGGGTPAQTGPAAPLPSYLARYPRENPRALYFLQWQRSGNSVAGTLTFAYPAAGNTPATAQSITGEIDGANISLDVGADTPERWNGERVGKTIVFRVELGDGSLQTLTFVPTKLAVFKRAVAELSGRR